MARMATAAVVAALSLWASPAYGLASTDTTTWGGDNTRASYQSNHNMDPAVVGSAQFAQIFKTALPGKYGGYPEQMYSQPLVYTPADGVQYVYIATTQNNVYKLDAKTGVIVASRNLHIPFLAADLDGCVDINPHVGIIATGVIDPATDTLYLTSKTYANQNGGGGAQGRPNGRWFVHALNVNDLSERPNFPLNLEGTVARNNPSRSFNGGIQNQRPALLLSGKYVYAGFGSHCVDFNFTGWIMGWDKATGQNVERWATEGDGVANTIRGGSLWMSGGGIASDDKGSMFFATGNGFASQLADVPVNGRTPPTSWEEAAMHLTINDDGSLTVVDFFMPYDKRALDGGDRDLGTSPLQILPSSTFSCGAIKRIGVVTGKTGKTYWLDLDNLGGYMNGPNKQDNVIQTYLSENSVYAGAGVYPLEGGYIYINVIQYPTHVFKFSCVNGVPSFTKVADSPTNNAYILGVGHGTTTSLNNQPGTGLLWTSDVQGDNLRIYNAVPVNGKLTQIKSFSIPGTGKFTRPVFGDGIVYQVSNQGFVYAFGAPTNPALTCNSYTFGTTNVGQTSGPASITCTAKIATKVNSVTSSVADYTLTGLPVLPAALAAGASFTFKVNFQPKSVGSIPGTIAISTTNNVAGYAGTTSVRLSGTGASQGPLLLLDPSSLVFTDVAIGTQGADATQSAILQNQGNSALTITNVQFSQNGPTGPFVAATKANGGLQVGPFTFVGVPASVPANSQVGLSVNFNPTASGTFTIYMILSSNGGNDNIKVTGSAGPAPAALLEFQTTDGQGWVTYQDGKSFNFGNVTENQTRSLKMRLTNRAGAGAVALSITVSKPPFGVPGIIGAANQVDLAEGVTLGSGQSATAVLYCSPPKTQWDTDPYDGTATWTMNTNDPTFGKHFIPFACKAVSEQAPPLLSNGLGRYRYAGCYKENNPGRQLAQLILGDDGMTVAKCVAACAAGGYTYCGLQYNRECWAGPTIPNLEVDEGNCNYPCKGDFNQVCGGNGVGSGAGGSYISLFVDSAKGNPPKPATSNTPATTSSTPASTPSPSQSVAPPPAAGPPYVNPGTGGYISLGCYAEPTPNRALSQQVNSQVKSVASCIAACGGTTYVGLEYGGECWCGSSNGAASAVSYAECNMVCTGNTTEYCGAGQRLNMYVRSNTPPPVKASTPTASAPAASSTTASTASTFTYYGCVREPSAGRALSTLGENGVNTMTIEHCQAVCAKNKYIGVEYGSECWCGDTLNLAGNAGATAGAKVADSECSFQCPGNQKESCGAGGRLSLYWKK